MATYNVYLGTCLAWCLKRESARSRIVCSSSWHRLTDAVVADYLRQQQQQAGAPPRSGYEELDTTLMPPRAAGQQTQDQYRASPAPEQPGHPGYAGL